MVQGGTDRRGCRFGVISLGFYDTERSKLRAISLNPPSPDIGTEGLTRSTYQHGQIVFEITGRLGWPNLGPRIEWLLHCS